MKTPGDQPVTELLGRWRAGDKDALEALVPLVYQELRAMAHGLRWAERPDHTLQSTALVHEAYLKLVRQGPPEVQNRAHFFALAARLMRQILVDYARGYRAAKRGAACRIQLDDGLDTSEKQAVDVVALDDALTALSEFDPQQSKIVELRFFGGLTVEETAEVLEISPATVKREWRIAKAWIARELQRE
ncbi:MAG TPA: sigma-70 family RNA polymerase sigma factor [Candidatus Sulfotelmatobacter sp.]|nr:sigma-70 family RNA polymerase sigma factor [Candidatus Sulfotelmatobacter sp.]